MDACICDKVKGECEHGMQWFKETEFHSGD